MLYKQAQNYFYLIGNWTKSFSSERNERKLTWIFTIMRSLMYIKYILKMEEVLNIDCYKSAENKILDCFIK